MLNKTTGVMKLYSNCLVMHIYVKIIDFSHEILYHYSKILINSAKMKGNE